ncbi:MAG: hypothetical protein UY09_C0016G0010 [Parcubacteria group bacterium GW2011_GWA2_47_8]|nr:MAG: hypothetical protein UY09_C0016G0010 [Parcubacteria group bacterium GW2011_GWA2_47_8]
MATSNDDRLNLRSGSNGFSQWLRENFASIVLPILAIIVLVGGLYLYTTSKETTTTEPDGNETAQVSDATNTVTEGTTEAATEEKQTAPTTTDDGTDRVTISRTSGSITVTAQRGDGVTHLARRALAEYLKNQASAATLSSEHKIYIEDYMQNRTGSQGLHIGDQLTFSNSLIQDGITAAHTLTNGQLDNLTQYVQLVPSLSVS